MVAPLRAVAVKRPEEAFGKGETLEKEWRELAWTRRPDPDVAAKEHRLLVSLLEAAGARPYYLPEDSRTNLDSLYAHDPCIFTNAGAVIFQMGKPARRGEGPAMAD